MDQLQVPRSNPPLCERNCLHELYAGRQREAHWFDPSNNELYLSYSIWGNMFHQTVKWCEMRAGALAHATQTAHDTQSHTITSANEKQIDETIKNRNSESRRTRDGFKMLFLKKRRKKEMKREEGRGTLNKVSARAANRSIDVCLCLYLCTKDNLCKCSWSRVASPGSIQWYRARRKDVCTEMRNGECEIG